MYAFLNLVDWASMPSQLVLVFGVMAALGALMGLVISILDGLMAVEEVKAGTPTVSPLEAARASRAKAEEISKRIETKFGVKALTPLQAARAARKEAEEVSFRVSCIMGQAHCDGLCPA